MKIEFDADFPEMIHPQIENLINDKVWILPKWLQVLYISYGNDDSTDCHIRTDKEYRFARLTVYGNFLRNPVWYQEETIFHEFVHIHISPLCDFAKEIVENVVKDNELLTKYLDRELTRFNEMATQDLAFAVNERQNYLHSQMKVLSDELIKIEDEQG